MRRALRGGGVCPLVGLSLFGLGACATLPERPLAPISSPPEAASQPDFVAAFTDCVAVVTNGTGKVRYDGKTGTVIGTAFAAPFALVEGR